MVRINVGINPRHLHDKHLGAEYNEILKLLGHVKKSPYPKGYAPTRFTLNKGHINFFKDKLMYLIQRWNIVCDECERRGRQTNRWLFWEHLSQADHKAVADNWNGWRPSQRDFELIKSRVLERCEQYGFDTTALESQIVTETV